MKIFWLIAWAGCAAGTAAGVTPPATVRLAGGRCLLGGREGNARPPREADIPPLTIGVTEVAVADLIPWLNAEGAPAGFASPQVVRRGGRFVPARGAARQPAAWMSHDDALAYCRWLSRALGRRARLPTEAEWEYAARGGVDNARYPWGWGPPDRRARFNADGPRRVGAYPPNGFGLYDMAGNVYEWCAAEDDGPSAPARGGSWSERDPLLLRVYHRMLFPCGYRDADVGLRIVLD